MITQEKILKVLYSNYLINTWNSLLSFVLILSTKYSSLQKI
jgi:hypothetical protein